MTADEVRIQDEIFETMWKADIAAVAKKEAKMRADRSKLFWKIRAHLSPESWDKVQEHLPEDDFKLMEVNQDPLILWTALKETHTSFSTGVNFNDAARARTAYATLQGTSEGLSSFKERMEVLIKALESLGVQTPTKQEQASDFFTRLNTTFKSKAILIENNHRLGGTFPSTLFEAYKCVAELATEKPIHTTTSVVYNTVEVTPKHKPTTGAKIPIVCYTCGSKPQQRISNIHDYGRGSVTFMTTLIGLNRWCS